MTFTQVPAPWPVVWVGTGYVFIFIFYFWLQLPGWFSSSTVQPAVGLYDVTSPQEGRQEESMPHGALSTQ